MKLTEDEKKNGWTVKKLKKYHKEREEAAKKRIFEKPKVKPDSQEGYNPFSWR